MDLPSFYSCYIPYFSIYTLHFLFQELREETAEMEKQPSSVLVILFLIILTFYAAETYGKKQAQRLGRFYKAKMKENSGIDTSLFRANHHRVNRAKIHSQDGLKEKDRIWKLPGQPEAEFSQYGGYVTVDKSAGRAMYYYFVEARKSQDSSPLLLWLNGGNFFYGFGELMTQVFLSILQETPTILVVD